MTATDPTVHVHRVPDISCDHCVRAIESALAPVAGVTAVDVDLDAKTVTVAGGDAAAVVAALDEAGYDVAD